MPAEVHVVVYDLIQPFSAGLRLLGTGAFHVGVEVHGKEWGYGFSYTGTGVFSSIRTGMELRETLLQGETVLSDDQVEEILDELRSEWIGADYDLVSHSCCSFADLFCRSLGVDPLPSWVANLAAAGATVAGGTLRLMSAEEREIVLTKAKSGEIDEKYTVESGATASASSLLKQAQKERGEEFPSFYVELGLKVEEAEEAAPDSPKFAASFAACWGEIRAAPTLLSQRSFHSPARTPEEVAMSRGRPQDGGCCVQ